MDNTYVTSVSDSQKSLKICTYTKVYVIAVGSNNCLDDNRKKLKHPLNDLSHFTRHILARFPEAQVDTLFGPQATGKKILRQIEETIKSIAQAVTAQKDSQGTIVFFYYTGHGTTTRKQLSATREEIRAALVTADAEYKNGELSDGLFIGGEGDHNSLLGALGKINARVYVVLDCCCGCSLTNMPNNKGILLEGIGEKELESAKIGQDQVPENCCILNACSMNGWAAESKGGSLFTNAFLEIVSRQDQWPDKDSSNPWWQQDVVLLDQADTIPIDAAMECVNRRLSDLCEIDLPSTAHAVYANGTNWNFPRLLDEHYPSKSSLDNRRVTSIRPPAPGLASVRQQEIDNICRQLQGDGEFHTHIVSGAKMSGKTTVVSLATKNICAAQDQDETTGNRPLAWLSLDSDMTVGYLLPFISQRIDPSPGGYEQRLFSLLQDGDATLEEKARFILDLVEEHYGVVVIDNAELLMHEGLTPEEEGNAQIREELNRIQQVISYLSRNMACGNIVLICEDLKSFRPVLKDWGFNDRKQFILVNKFSFDETCRILRNEYGVETPEDRLFSGTNSHSLAELLQGQYLLNRDQNLSIGPADNITEVLLSRLDSSQEYVLFISLFRGTNTVSFLKEAYNNDNTIIEVLLDLDKKGLVVKEGDRFCMHPDLAKQCQMRWKSCYHDHKQQWHTWIGNKYREAAQKIFQLSLIHQAKRHYEAIQEPVAFAEVLLDETISTELKNWGYIECLINWLNLLYDQQIDAGQEPERKKKKARFRVFIQLLILERHKLDFHRLSEIDHARDLLYDEQDANLKAQFHRAIGEMHFAKRDYEQAQFHIDQAYQLIEQWIHQSQLQLQQLHLSRKDLVLGRIEYSRIALRIAELRIHKGLPENALHLLRLIDQRLMAEFSEIRESDRSIGHPIVSHLLHQLSVTRSIEAMAYLETQNYQKARVAAAEVIKLSLFCRSYATGDILGRAIGHIRYVLASAHIKKFRTSANWHIAEALSLLKQRRIEEVWWRSYAQLAKAVLLCETGGSGKETSKFDEAIIECDKALLLLRNRVIPSQPDDAAILNWDANPEVAAKLLSWYGRMPLTKNNDYAFDAVHQLSIDDCEELKALQASLFTDPWRETELLWVRARTIRRKLESSEFDDTMYQQDSNAGKFAAFIGFTLAKAKGYIPLMHLLLREAAYIYKLDARNPQSLSRADVLMRDCVSLSSWIDNKGLLTQRLLELAEILDPNKTDSPIARIQSYATLSVLYLGLRWSSENFVLPRELLHHIRKLEDDTNIQKDFRTFGKRYLLELYRVDLALNRRRGDRLPICRKGTLQNTLGPHIEVSTLEVSVCGASAVSDVRADELKERLGQTFDFDIRIQEVPGKVRVPNVQLFRCKPIPETHRSKVQLRFDGSPCRALERYLRTFGSSPQDQECV